MDEISAYAGPWIWPVEAPAVLRVPFEEMGYRPEAAGALASAVAEHLFGERSAETAARIIRAAWTDEGGPVARPGITINACKVTVSGYAGVVTATSFDGRNCNIEVADNYRPLGEKVASRWSAAGVPTPEEEAV